MQWLCDVYRNWSNLISRCIDCNLQCWQHPVMVSGNNLLFHVDHIFLCGTWWCRDCHSQQASLGAWQPQSMSLWCSTAIYSLWSVQLSRFVSLRLLLRLFECPLALVCILDWCVQRVWVLELVYFIHKWMGMLWLSIVVIIAGSSFAILCAVIFSRRNCRHAICHVPYHILSPQVFWEVNKVHLVCFW